MPKEKIQTLFLGVLLVCICILIGTSVSGSSYEKEDNRKTAGEEEESKTDNTLAAAFTFEGGPGVYTERLLNALEKEQVKATFFLDPETIGDYPGLVSRMKELECEVGLWIKKEDTSEETNIFEVQEKLEQGEQQLMKLLGEEPELLRVEETGALTDLLAESFSRIEWSIDGENSDVSELVKQLLSQIGDGDIIRLNDTHETAVAAVEIIIPQLKEKGFRLLTVEQLAVEKGVELERGQTYREFQEQKEEEIR